MTSCSQSSSNNFCIQKANTSTMVPRLACNWWSQDRNRLNSLQKRAVLKSRTACRKDPRRNRLRKDSTINNNFLNTQLRSTSNCKATMCNFSIWTSSCKTNWKQRVMKWKCSVLTCSSSKLSAKSSKKSTREYWHMDNNKKGKRWRPTRISTKE